MKALTLIQPWASLIVDGVKRIETRSWPTKYRGPLLIHAGVKVDRAACEQFGYNPDTVPTSAILGQVEIVDCVQFPNASAPPDLYGDFTPGRYGWLLQLLCKWRKPFTDVKGSLGLWNYTL